MGEFVVVAVTLIFIKQKHIHTREPRWSRFHPLPSIFLLSPSGHTAKEPLLGAARLVWHAWRRTTADRDARESQEGVRRGEGGGRSYEFFFV